MKNSTIAWWFSFFWLIAFVIRPYFEIKHEHISFGEIGILITVFSCAAVILSEIEE